MHVHLRSYDYFADKPTASGGLARLATLIRAQRAEAQNCLLVDNGDFLQGSLMGDYAAFERPPDHPAAHPAIAAMNCLDYDAVGLGNHEFNFGLPFLSSALAEARFPVLCSNVFSLPSAAQQHVLEQTLLPPFTILTRQITCDDDTLRPVRIGIFSVLPTQVMQWDRRHVIGRIETRDIIDTAKKIVPQMRAEGADIVIALCHSGIGEADHTPNMEHAAVPLGAVAGIDAMVCGHSHLQLPGPDHPPSDHVDPRRGTINGTPAVMPGFGGNVLGQIDLGLRLEGGIWRVVEHQSVLLPTAERGDDNVLRPLVAEDPEVLQRSETAHRETLTYIRRPVGTIARPVHSYFSLLGNDASVQMVSEAQKLHLEGLIKGTRWQNLPLLSAAAPFKTGGRGGPDHYTDLPSSALAIRNLADLYVFPNMFRAVLITGSQLRGWLERSAGAFRQIEAGRDDQLLLDPDFPSYNFDVFDGITYEIDITQPSRFNSRGALVHPEANRIKHLQYRGVDIRDTDQFVVATNSFRAGGGGCFPGAEGDSVIMRSNATSRDIVLSYIQSGAAKDLPHRETWRFTPAGGARVLFDTAPKALPHLDEISRFAPEDLGPCGNGFTRLRLTL